MVIDLTNFLPNEKSAFNETVGDINKRIQTNHVTTHDSDTSSENIDRVQKFDNLAHDNNNHLLI